MPTKGFFGHIQTAIKQNNSIELHTRYALFATLSVKSLFLKELLSMLHPYSKDIHYYIINSEMLFFLIKTSYTGFVFGMIVALNTMFYGVLYNLGKFKLSKYGPCMFKSNLPLKPAILYLACRSLNKIIAHIINATPIKCSQIILLHQAQLWQRSAPQFT